MNGRRPAPSAWGVVLLALALTAALSPIACAVRVPRSVGVAIPGPAGRLEGSLFLPDEPGPHPAMVLIHSARENSRLDYLQEARYFASRGVVALAYDKRGTGGSAGDLNAANFGSLAQDAVAAARWLRGRPEVDSARVGYWGHGQGGWVAPIAAAMDSNAAFVVMVSAPVVSPLEQSMVQRTEELAARGLAKGDAEAIARLRRRIWDYWLTPAGSGTAVSDSIHDAARRARKRPWYANAVVAHDLPESLIVDEGMGLENHPARWWYAGDMPTFWSLRHDPVGVLMRVRAPVLAVYGEKDRVVPVVESAVHFQAALGRGYNRRGVVRIFRGADHAMLVRRGAGIFSKIESAPGYRDTVMAWVERTVAKRRD